MAFNLFVGVIVEISVATLRDIGGKSGEGQIPLIICFIIFVKPFSTSRGVILDKFVCAWHDCEQVRALLSPVLFFMMPVRVEYVLLF